MRGGAHLFCLGLGLTSADFSRTFQRPRLLPAVPANLLARRWRCASPATTYAAARLRRAEPADRIVLTLGSTTRQFAVAAFVALTLCRDARLLPPPSRIAC